MSGCVRACIAVRFALHAVASIIPASRFSPPAVIHPRSGRSTQLPLFHTHAPAHAHRDTKLTKFHGIYQQDDRDLREERQQQGLEKAYSFMIRVRVPGGVSTAEQDLAMDSLADTHANGTIKLTTRQAYQLHGVIKRKLKPTIQGLCVCVCVCVSSVFTY